MAEALILPAQVGAERTGLNVETLRAAWGVQTLTRRYADGSSEGAFRIPTFLLEQIASWQSPSD